MRPRGRRPARIAAGVVIVLAGACSAEPTVIQLPPLEVVIASGDGQFGVIGQDLGAPLRVLVRSQATGNPREDVTVVWEVTQGTASILGVSATLTDETGSTEVRVRMGAGPGEVRIKATVDGQGNATATFEAFGVNRPTLTQVTPTAAVAGQSVTLSGSDFSPVAGQNVVLFSGIRGRVLDATFTSLVVDVPECLPAREVEVSVQLGVVPSTGTVPLTVTGGTQVTSLQVGELLDVADASGLTCHALPGAAGAQYLALAYSASPLGAARHPFRLTVLGSGGPVAAPPPLAASGTPTPSDPDEGLAHGGTLQERWDQHLRGLEDDILRGRASPTVPRAGTPPALSGPAAVPSVGERRTFNVLTTAGGFDEVTAEARHVGSRAAIFVDLEAPAAPDGFTGAELAALAARFDQVIHPEVTAMFGSPSDLDTNERVIILLTPAVNRLTPRGSSGFVGAFFYGVDLLPSSAGSNRGEVFYVLVPDPDGQFSDPRTKQQVTPAVPAVLAHEFQHMVHFNERVLVRGAPGQEALWLSEGLAQMAEEIVARAYFALGDGGSTTIFRAGVVQRAKLYLARPDTVSVVVTGGQGSLTERGAGFLSMLYVSDRLGTDVLGRLTRTTRSGVTNVEAETGLAWPMLLADWWSATYLDGQGAGTGPLSYPSIDLRAYLASFGGSFPLVPSPTGPGDATRSGSLPSSGVSYYVLSPPAGSTVSVRLGGEAGGPSTEQAAVRLRLIRIS